MRELLQLLLSCGLSFNAKRAQAIEKNHYHLAKAFLEHGADTLTVNVNEIRKRTGRKISKKLDKLIQKYPPLTDEQRSLLVRFTILICFQHMRAVLTSGHVCRTDLHRKSIW